MINMNEISQHLNAEQEISQVHDLFGKLEKLYYYY